MRAPPCRGSAAPSSSPRSLSVENMQYCSLSNRPLSEARLAVPATLRRLPEARWLRRSLPRREPARSSAARPLPTAPDFRRLQDNRNSSHRKIPFGLPARKRLSAACRDARLPPPQFRVGSRDAARWPRQRGREESGLRPENGPALEFPQRWNIYRF